MSERIRVLVVGAAGSMGKEVVKTVLNAADLVLVGAVDRSHFGEDAGAVAGVGRAQVGIAEDLEAALALTKPEVMIDFTQPNGLMGRITAALRRGVRPVIGTTGLSQGEIEDVRRLAAERQLGAIIAPNFAVGALIMMHCAALAAPHFAQTEIIELHHPEKKDAPSGTAIKTAELIAQARQAAASSVLATPGAETERVPGARGGEYEGVRLHSVRLPGFVAHQEVIFGSQGEVFTLRHDSLSRQSFMPGVLLAVHKVVELSGLLYGIESLLFENSAR